jgi:hypothetical protein
MSAGTLSPTLMCTISPGTKFRARNVSSCPSRKLKTNCVLDKKVIYTYIYNEITEFTEYLCVCVCIYINLHSTSLLQSSAPQLPCNVPTNAGYLRTMLSSVIQRDYWHQPSKCKIQPFKTELNLRWTSPFHNIRSWLRYWSVHWPYTALVNSFNYNKPSLPIFKISQLAVLKISRIWHLSKSTGGPQSQTRHLGKVKNLLAVLGINSRLKFHENGQNVLKLFYICRQTVTDAPHRW